MKGRKPKPTALKQLNGSAKVNPGRLNPNEPAGSVTTYQKPPHYLNAYSKREWDRLLPLLIEGQILRAEDLAAFEAHCIAYGDLVGITKALGSKYLDDDGRVNPLVAKKQAAITALLKTAAPLGLTPSDRTRVATLEAQDKPDGIEQFFSSPEQLRRVK